MSAADSSLATLAELRGGGHTVKVAVQVEPLD
jgi:hypothetical protein